MEDPACPAVRHTKQTACRAQIRHLTLGLRPRDKAKWGGDMSRGRTLTQSMRGLNRLTVVLRPGGDWGGNCEGGCQAGRTQARGFPGGRGSCGGVIIQQVLGVQSIQGLAGGGLHSHPQVVEKSHPSSTAQTPQPPYPTPCTPRPCTRTAGGWVVLWCWRCGAGRSGRVRSLTGQEVLHAGGWSMYLLQGMQHV